MKPIICVPMGDPAGVGPEILAASVTDPVVRQSARVVAVGDENVLRRAAKAMNVDPVFNFVDESLANIKDGALNLINLANMDMDAFEYGKVSAQGGKAAYEYIVKSVELASADKVDALATTPINKESLKAAAIPFIGHTEILAGLTSSHDPLTMFQVHDLRVFFLTRHLSLLEACRTIKRERVLDYIHRCTEALRRLGIKDPTLAVAGLNPHSGEHGLFGSEEDDEITPAIEQARKEGYAVEGPKPADSVFHFALNGAWDAVLSLYHDQGHIATKMVDFERTISLTLGLPFLRTSVDHGTAFDIAGKGKVSPLSMVEAIRLAALYAPNFKSAAGK
ncbi:4-hydroxythreonine-4-phosphate dehydrogenase PdxA [Desulfovibrio sp. OttesenSCG-928-O18]|nr:4-hydroxythreonine-4-phosphate dehydrogenase PdxA [Desulfovibrio sp. OttesenSCG-928-O18]